MPSLKLTRTSYSDPTQSDTPPRTANVQDAEALVDFEQYQRPLEQVHASSLHGWGVASGLAVNANAHAPGIQVLPGVAVDATGRHISLATAGNAEIGSHPDGPGGSVLLPVTAAGLTLPTSGLSGTMHLTVSFRETFDLAALISSGRSIFQMDHTPWFRLVPVNDPSFINDGTSVVLAQVSLDSGANVGNVLALAPGLRRPASSPTGLVSFLAAQATAAGVTLGVAEAVAGTLGADDSGTGLEIKATTLHVDGELIVSGVHFSAVAAEAAAAVPGSGVITPQGGRYRVPLFLGSSGPVGGAPSWTIASPGQLTATINTSPKSLFSLSLPNKAIVTGIEMDLIPAPPVPLFLPGTNNQVGVAISLIQIQLVQLSHDNDAQTIMTQLAMPSDIPLTRSNPLNLAVNNNSFSYFIMLTMTPEFPPAFVRTVFPVTVTKILLNYTFNTLF